MLKRFSDIRMTDVSICGGKGASLGELKNAGFPIPDGFVLTTKAFGKESAKREKEVLAAFDKLDTKFVAVRSSGTKEDGADDSFAGQFDTYLFVTRETLIQKIKECHESVKSERILSYCKYKGIDNDSIKVAVVVQKMVNSDSAGVCFTVNPISGESDEVMIEAGFGVGEAVVSGMITPDNYVVNMTTGTVEKNISKQEKKLILDDMGGTKEVEIDTKDQTSQKLSDEHILELAEFAKKIENHYGKPMDTEWAVENGELFILQARPITTELKHNIYDEVAAERQSEDWFLMEEIKGARPFILSGRGRRLTQRYYEEFNLPLEDIMVYKDDTLFIYVKHRQLYLTAKAMLQKSLSDVEFLSSISQRNKKIQNDTFLYCDELEKVNLKDKTDEELMQIFVEYMERLETMITIGRVDCILEFDNEMFSTTLRNYLAKRIKEKELQMNVAEVFSVFTTPCEKTRGIIQEESLQAIANEIKKDPKTLNFFLENSVETIAKDVENVYPTISKRLDEHTNKFNWYFFMYEGPARDKSNFIAELKQLLSSKQSKQTENVNLIEAKAELIKKLDINDYYQKLLKSAEEMVFNKDLRKHALYRMSYVGFNIFEEVAQRCNISVEEAWNLTPREIQKLTIDDIKNLDLKSRDKGMMMKFYKGEHETDFDSVNANKFMEDVSEKNKLTGNITTLQGSCAYQGKVTGKVRIVDSPEDMKNFKEGEILVSHQTDPDILPAMKLAAAFVTDLGGITCHAAIVSREMKKPCIVGTKIATQVLKDGDLVEVDADNGIVKILENKDKGNNLEVNIGNKIFTPEFRKHQNTIYFSYQGVPFFSCIFSKCCTTNDTDWTTPANYVCEFNNLETATQYVIGDFVEKGENMIENMIEGKKDASMFLKKQDEIVLKCIEKCDKYIKDGKTNFLDIRSDIKLAFEAGCHVINLSYALQKYLENLNKTNQKLYKSISENINAPKKSFVNEAGDYLKNLIKKYPDNFEIVYNEFMGKYGWFQNSYLGINHIDKKRLKEYAEDLLKAQISKKSKKKLRIEKKYSILVETASNAIIYQDNKKRLGFMAMQIMENRLRDYSKKIRIPFNDLLWLTVEEIIENDEKTIKDKINEYKYTGKRIGIMTENGYTNISEDFWWKVVELNKPQNNIKSFNGITGCKGKYTGSVKIISNIEKDKNKFKKGDILVTGMTRPEFVPLIKIAGGIITNEGGITCHAAIISRELGKPCIIGTKIATQVLKDGDLVEVDADNGTVKIL